MMSNVSGWLPLNVGAPQGSILGPFCYNVHCNDLMFDIENECDVFNYADDNTICCYGKNNDEVKTKLHHIISKLLSWFEDNNMKVNCNKFQYMFFGNGYN